MGRATIYALVMVPVSFATAGILVLIAWISSSGRAVTTGTVAVVNADIVTSSTRFWVLFVLGVLVLLVWAVINYASYHAGTPTTQRLSGATPPVWAFAVLLGVTTFHWFFWAIGPGAWNAWLSSQTFWPMNVAIVLATFFTSQHGPAAWYAGFALWALLLVAIGIGAYDEKYGHLWSDATPTPPVASSRDTIFTLVSRPGQPAEVVMPPGWWIDWTPDQSRFTTHAIWRGRDKVRVFVTQPGVESAEIKIRKYYDPTRKEGEGKGDGAETPKRPRPSRPRALSHANGVFTSNYWNG